MSDHTITLKGLEARVFIDPGHETTGAYTIVFDENGDVVVVSESKRYSGFCTQEILYSQLGETIWSRRGIDYPDIADELERQGYVCHCEDDEEDDADDECEGHESLRGDSMGVTVYCDGSCR